MPHCNQIFTPRHASLCSPWHGPTHAKSRPEKTTSPPITCSSPDGKQRRRALLDASSHSQTPNSYSWSWAPAFSTPSRPCQAWIHTHSNASCPARSAQARRLWGTQGSVVPKKRNDERRPDNTTTSPLVFRGPPQGAASPELLDTSQPPFHTLTTPTHAQTKALWPGHGISLRLRARPNPLGLPSAFSWLLHDKDL